MGNAGAGGAAGDDVTAVCEAVAPGVVPRAGAAGVAVGGASVAGAKGAGTGTAGATGVGFAGAGEDDGATETESALLDAGFEPGFAGNEGCNAGLAAALVGAGATGADGRTGGEEAGAVVVARGAEGSTAGVAVMVGAGAAEGGVGVGAGRAAAAVAFARA